MTLAKAKSLLSQAGHASGISLTLLTQNDSIHLAAGAGGAVRADRGRHQRPAQAGGQRLLLRRHRRQQGRLRPGPAQLAAGLPERAGNIAPLFDSSQIGNGNYNASHYSNPAVDKLIAQASAETDQATAQALWGQADRMIMADAPVVPLLYARNAFLRGSAVANFFAPPYPPYVNMLVVGLAG